jgi:hypothetical protein
MFKFLKKWLVRRSITREIEEELSNRIKAKLFLEPMDDEMASLFAITKKSPIEEERLLQMLSQMRELERAKMMKEESCALR